MPRTVKPPDERRRELLEIGIDLFLKEGSAGVSIQSVIQRANVATGLFYYYFKSKEAFLEEAITSYVSNLSAHLSDAITRGNDNALINIKEAVAKFSAHVREASPHMRDEIIHTPQFHIVMHGLLERIQPAVEQLIARGVSQGRFRVLSPAITASFMLNGLMGILHRGNALPAQDVQREAERLVLSSLGVEKD